MAQTIRRGAKTVRRQARAQGNKTKVRKARAQTNSLIDALMRVLPFTEEQLHKFFLAVILGLLLLGAWVIASLAGLTDLAGRQFALYAADAGYEVRRVEVRGAERMNKLKVYERVLGEQDQAMPLVDLDQIRASLLELNWVHDARVSRQLPDTIVVDIVEREPHAVLEKPNRLVLIDATGHELEPVSKADAKGKLLISGPGAQQQVEALTKLLDAAPALKPQVTGAEWVGNRRWNLTFKTGQALALPQGEQKAATALMSFARLDGVNRLLGGKVVAFDMRTPERIYMRVPGRAQEELDMREGGI
ncbi:cell division protein FtsQ [Altererythrobacter atlanticus]|uniref:Cell division protein FtsQ n=1 Tax=Croceibacterium atlanticum TaxID=1267766 RepID=A0A0F7KTC5_9SPHN|nr:cell division protein FtsQ/DivIB [Croceibacterium atlanticum]AKH42381.1 cell division protein FtsQ [Croceibacterium atlanticum]MBB5731158.1 cell division protein FtsQ [Croceibacterium atlanticum]